MKKFQVMLKETAIYVIDVEAKDQIEAEEVAESAFVQSDDPNEFFSHVENRDPISVKEDDV